MLFLRGNLLKFAPIFLDYDEMILSFELIDFTRNLGSRICWSVRLYALKGDELNIEDPWYKVGDFCLSLCLPCFTFGNCFRIFFRIGLVVLSRIGGMDTSSI